MGKKKSSKRPWSVTERLEAVQAYQKGLTGSEVASLYGMSATTVNGWVRAYAQRGLAGLEPVPLGVRRLAASAKSEAAGQLVAEAVKADPGAGIGKVQGALYRRGFLDLARETVRGLMRRAGAGPKAIRAGRRNRPAQVRSFERANPNDLWQTDIMTFMLKGQYRVYLIGYMDDHSRFLVGWGLHRFQTQAHVLEVFRAALEKHGMPKEVLSDNGRQYYSWRGRSAFTEMLTKLGIRHIRSRPYHPQTLGKIESFWRNLYQECLSQVPLGSFEEAQAKIGEWVEYYNFKRPHQGIGNLIPSDRFYRVGDQVRQIVESNTARLEEAKPPLGVYAPPAYLVGNLGGKELRVVAKEAQVLVREAGAEKVESAGASPTVEGTAEVRDGACQGAEAGEPAGAAGLGRVGVGQAHAGDGAMRAGGGVPGAVLPVDASGAGGGAAGLGGEGSGAQAHPGAEGSGACAAVGGPSGAPGEGSQGPAQGSGPLAAGGGGGAADHPPAGLGACAGGGV